MIKRPLPTESQEQQAVIAWWASYARTKQLDPRLLFAIPNAAKRSYGLAARMRKEGLRSGVPDLMLTLPKTGHNGAGWSLFSGLFIEMKRIGAKPSPEQLAYIDLLRRQGYNALICYGADEAIRAIKAYCEA